MTITWWSVFLGVVGIVVGLLLGTALLYRWRRRGWHTKYACPAESSAMQLHLVGAIHFMERLAREADYLPEHVILNLVRNSQRLREHVNPFGQDLLEAQDLYGSKNKADEPSNDTTG